LNPYISLGSVGMVLIGLLSVIYWRRKSKAGWSYFALGAAIWVVAISAKVAMDLTITPIFIADPRRYDAHNISGAPWGILWP